LWPILKYANFAKFIFGTAIVIFATYLYSVSDLKRKRPPPINIVSYEKTTIDNGYTPREERPSAISIDPLESVKLAGLSTSRPNSPMRHHSRAGSSRGKVRDD
jgi:UDP-sugar transporter A1/2/3